MSNERISTALLVLGFMLMACSTILLSCSGCSGSKFSAPDAQYRTRTTETLKDGTVRVTETATKAKGSDVSSDTAEDVEVGSVAADGSEARVGEGAYQGMQEHTSMTPLYVAGVAIVLGSVAVGWLVTVRLGLITGAAGMSLLVLTRFLDVYPFVSMVVMGVIGLGLIGYLIYTGRLGEDAQRTLGTVVAAIERASDSKALKADIEKTAKARGNDTVVKDTINRTKKREI